MELLVVTKEQERLVEACVRLLDGEWSGRSHRELVESSSGGVETSFAIVRKGTLEPVLGHVRLRPASMDLHASAGLIVSLVVDREERGKGVGRGAMAEVELEARRRGYGYLYLSTTDQVRFYEQCGYARTEVGAGAGAVLRRVADEGVASLESLLLRRQGGGGSGGGGGGRGGVTWLRKRLRWTVEGGASVWEGEGVDVGKWARVCVPRVPSVLQVGPSCGFAVLQSIARSVGRGVRDEELERARDLGCTSDGELLTVDAARTVAERVFLLEGVEIVGFEGIECEIASPWMIAYDRDPTSHLPGCFGGRNAHWTLVVGVLVDDGGREMVALLQPMACRILYAPKRDLLESNAQLVEIGADKRRRHAIDGDGHVASLAHKALTFPTLLSFTSPS